MKSSPPISRPWKPASKRVASVRASWTTSEPLPLARRRPLSGLDKLVKTTVFLMDLGDFAAMNEVYAQHVGDAPPARSTVQISGLPSGALVEIEAIAHI